MKFPLWTLGVILVQAGSSSTGSMVSNQYWLSLMMSKIYESTPFVVCDLCPFLVGGESGSARGFERASEVLAFELVVIGESLPMQLVGIPRVRGSRRGDLRSFPTLDVRLLLALALSSWAH